MLRTIAEIFVLLTLIMTVVLAIFATDFMYFPVLLFIIVYLIALIRLGNLIAARAYDILKALELLVKHENSKGKAIDQKLGTLWQMMKDSGTLN